MSIVEMNRLAIPYVVSTITDIDPDVYLKSHRRKIR